MGRSAGAPWWRHDLHRDRPQGGVCHRPRAPHRRAGVLLPDLLSAGVRRARAENGRRAMQPVVQPSRRDAARVALPASPGDRGETDPLRPGRDPEHHRGPAAGLDDVPVPLPGDLSAENRRAIYVPEMFANGYQTLTDDAEAIYQVSEFYTPDSERGLRYSDPQLRITL